MIYPHVMMGSRDLVSCQGERVQIYLAFA